MCRLYGYFSSLDTCNHHRFLHGDTPFVNLSQKHGDGWGVAYYQGQSLFVSKATSQAKACPLFTQVGRKASGHCIIAHLRKATTGSICMEDTHPFRFHNWVFVHNGNIKNFTAYRPALKQLVLPELLFHIQGQTDSELLFFIFLSELKRRNLLERQAPLPQYIDAILTACKTIQDIIGLFQPVDGPPDETYLSFILTNSQIMLAHQGGKPIYYLLQDTICQLCYQCTQTYTFSSEPLTSDGIWQAIEVGDLMALDQTMMKFNFNSMHLEGIKFEERLLFESLI